MKIIRKFSVTPAKVICEGVDDLTPGKSYPVLIIDRFGNNETNVLIATDEGRFVWLDIDNEEAFLTSIDD